MTIGGRRVKCQCCGRTAKVLTVNRTQICTHCFKAYTLGLLVGRALASGNVWEKYAEKKEEKE